MKYNVDEVIGMAWFDKVSFEEIKKNRSFGKRSYFYNEKKFKKKVISFGGKG